MKSKTPRVPVAGTATFNFRATLLLLALLFATVSASAQQMQTLRGHVPAAVAGLQPTGRLPSTNRLHLVIGLPLRNQAALTNLLAQLYDPASTNFHRWLTSQQFMTRFGPVAADYQKVLQFAGTNRLDVVATNNNLDLVDVSATVADIEKAFRVTMRTYRHPREPREFYAPDVEPSVDASVPMVSIAGLNNYVVPFPMSHPQSATGPAGSATGSGPRGFFQGYDFRNAYVPAITQDGSGQNVGLVEFDSFFTNDIITYETGAGFPSVPLQEVQVDGGDGVPSTNQNSVAEVSLDIEMVISMAPGLKKLYLFEGTNTDHILGGMASHTEINQFSSSWGMTLDAKAEDYFLQMATQGQTFFQASGDGDAYTNPISWPSDDPNVTSVGGTSLTMDSSSFFYVSETVWNSGFQTNVWYGNGAVPGGGYWGSGGGISSTYTIPGWQKGAGASAVGGSTTFRNIPDVALTAFNVWVDYFNGLSGPFEGTSCAAPLWAGFTAVANQQAAADGKPSLGFLNPALYALGEGSTYVDFFHDITVGNNFWPGSPSEFNSAPGYDLCTGWGTPTGLSLITALENYAGPVYVDFNYTGSVQDGSYNTPFKTLAGGTNAVSSHGTIIIKTAGSSSETMTISKPMSIISIGGAATIGH